MPLLNGEQQQEQRSTPQHNWPPLPSIIPIAPCFYQDINVEIPVHFQKTVTFVYRVYLLYVFALAVNLVASLFSYFFMAGGIGIVFISLVELLLFSPCAFLFWYRPLYKAFRNDSSFNFLIFFFVLFAHTIFCGVQAVGFSSYAVGWLNAIGAYKVNVAVGIVMTISAVTFTAAFCGMTYSLVNVHRLYSGYGYSVGKARQEFTNGVMADRGMMQGAAQVAAGVAVNTAMRGGNPFA